MTRDLRARIRAALSARASLRGLTGPERIETVTGPLDAFVDAVMAVLDDEFPPTLVAAPPLTDDEAAELHRAWLEVQADSRGGLIVLPPNASDLWRRHTPEQRRDWLIGHRDEAIANGIPGDLVDLMIRDGGDGHD